MYIFSSVKNEKFFTILSRPNKYLYDKIVCNAFDIVEHKTEKRIDKITFKYMIEEEIENCEKSKEVIDIASLVNDIVNALIECGWIISVYDGIKGCDYINFTPDAFDFIKTQKYKHKQKKDIRTGEYLAIIKSTVRDLLDKDNIDTESYRYPYRFGLLRIMQASYNLAEEPRKIEEKIKADMQDILNSENSQEAGNKMIKYFKEIENGYISDFNEYSNVPSWLIFEIKNLFDLVKNDISIKNKIISDMFNYYSEDNIEKDEADLRQEFHKTLTIIDENINKIYKDNKNRAMIAMKTIIEKINMKLKYLSATSMNYDASVGKMLNLISYISDEDNEEFSFEEMFNDALNITQQKILHPNCLYEKRESYVVTKSEPVKKAELQEEDILKLFINNGQKFDVKNANKVAKRFLEGRSEILVSNLTNIEEEFENVRLCGLCAGDERAEYVIEKIDEFISINGAKFNNFYIRSKEKI